jgi:hypothetical protein
MSVTAGTIFQNSNLPFVVWLCAARKVTNQKHGVSALGRQRVLGQDGYFHQRPVQAEQSEDEHINRVLIE